MFPKWSVLAFSVMFCLLCFSQDVKFNTSLAPTETRKIIVVVDTGIDLSNPAMMSLLCNGGSKDFTGKGMTDFIGHGTAVSTLIMKDLDPNKYCLVVLKYMHMENENGWHSVEAFSWAADMHATLVNFSSGGFATSCSETAAIQNDLMSGALVTVAAGNQGHDMSGNRCDYYPACAIKDPNFYVVGALNDKGTRAWYSNFGGPVVNWALGEGIVGGYKQSGTSFAAPNFANWLLKGMKDGKSR